MTDKKDITTDALATEMQVTFDPSELAQFFSGFASLEEIARALCAPLGFGDEMDASKL